MLLIDYDENECQITFNPSEPWDHTVMNIDSLVKGRNYETDCYEIQNGGLSISIPYLIHYFDGILEIIRRLHGQEELHISDSAREIISFAKDIVESPDVILDQQSEDDIQSKLIRRKWNNNLRSLSRFQIHNLLKTSRRTNAAIFSVPGAGKTVEALAYSTIITDKDPIFLIVCPRNAYNTWEEELEVCLGISRNQILRATGSDDDLRGKLLSGNSNFRAVLVNYNRLWYRFRFFTEYLRTLRDEGFTTVAIFDESHHFKGGKSFTSAVKRVAPFADHRLILSGTPMPKGPADLVHQFRSLLPNLMNSIEEENVIEMTENRFVRTTKDDLGLIPAVIEYRFFDMDPFQREVYQLLTDYYAAEYAARGNRRILAEIIRLQRILIYLVMHSSNPLLVDNKFIDILGNVDSQLASKLENASQTMHGYGPKVRYACDRARELVAEGKKVLIWSSFIENVSLIASELDDLGAVYIRGDVPTSDFTEAGYSERFQSTKSDDVETTREERIRKFKDDDSCMVLVANPSAAGEGISLHDVCHHAIYVDRTFHATEFMQSMDRIHRYGRDENGDIICAKNETFIEILVCNKSVDQLIHRNLARKMTAMYEWLNDPSLSPQLGLLEPWISEEEMIEFVSSG
jgi:SNF2 family DNA or RNA helicase